MLHYNLLINIFGNNMAEKSLRYKHWPNHGQATPVGQPIQEWRAGLRKQEFRQAKNIAHLVLTDEGLLPLPKRTRGHLEQELMAESAEADVGEYDNPALKAETRADSYSESARHRAESGPSVSILTISQPYLNAREVAGRWGHAGESLLGYITIGDDRMAGVFYNEPTRGAHHTDPQNVAKMELVPFNMTNHSEPVPMFDYSIPIQPEVPLYLDRFTGDDGTSLSWSNPNQLEVNLGTSGTVQVWGRQQEVAA